MPPLGQFLGTFFTCLQAVVVADAENFLVFNYVADVNVDAADALMASKELRPWAMAWEAEATAKGFNRNLDLSLCKKQKGKEQEKRDRKKRLPRNL